MVVTSHDLVDPSDLGQAITAIRLPPSPAFLAAVDRAWARGDAVLPLDPTAPVPVVESVCNRVRPTLVVDEDGRHERPFGHRVPPGTALVMATSGTTGDPKGVLLSHDAVLTSVGLSLDRLGCEPGERWLCCLPTHHVAGLAVLLRSRALGTDAVVHPSFDVAAVDAAVSSGEVHHVSLVPTQLGRLLDAGVPLDRLRSVLLGGAAAPDELLARAVDAGLRVVTSYGMTETCGGCVYDGEPLDGVDVRIAEDDRIHLRGPVLFDGYLGDRRRRLEVLSVDGWLRTSDRGHLDGDGRLVVDGRADDVVVSGGENVPSRRVADHVRSLVTVSDCVVVGVDDPEWGQRAVAVVEPAPGSSPTPGELRDELRRSLPRAWVPVVVVVDALPRTTLGKPDLVAVGELAREHPRP